jgi:hypothetical protein
MNVQSNELHLWHGKSIVGLIIWEVIKVINIVFRNLI